MTFQITGGFGRNVAMDDRSIEKESWNFSNRVFGEKEFSLLLQEIKETSSLANLIKEITFTKRLLTESQIQDIQNLASSMKSFKILDSDGDRIGSLICDWSSYNQDKKNASTFGMRETTKKAVELFKKEFGKLPEEILDFGAGTGQDALPLLGMGCPHVVALDAEEEALEILAENVPKELKHRIAFVNTPFKNYTVEKLFNVINSSFSWPYRPSEEFPFFWKKTVELLAPNGYIAGQFFGKPAKAESGMTYHSKEDIENLIKNDFDMLWFNQEKKTEVYGGENPPWGILYHVVARKKS